MPQGISAEKLYRLVLATLETTVLRVCQNCLAMYIKLPGLQQIRRQTQQTSTLFSLYQLQSVPQLDTECESLFFFNKITNIKLPPRAKQ